MLDKKIKNIFISHTHIDHILGVIWIVREYVRYYNRGYEIRDYPYTIATRT